MREDVRQDTNFKVTIEQIGRLERALLAVRESSTAPPDTLDTIAAIQYQEIARLRSELDAALGFAEEASDLVVSLQGPNVGLGKAPASVIATTLDNVRGAVQTVSSYLITGQWKSKGRPPQVVSQSTDFQFAGVASGSVRLKLNLPDPQSLFRDFEREPIERSVRLLLETVRWVSSNTRLDEFEQSIKDDRLIRLLLTQVRRVTPPARGVVQRVEFSGRLAGSNGSHFLSHSATKRIMDALNEVSPGETRVTEEGKLRSVDIDSGDFELRQRPDNKPNLPCRIQSEDLPQALDYLVRNIMVIAVGVQRVDDRGWPSRLDVEHIYEAGMGP